MSEADPDYFFMVVNKLIVEDVSLYFQIFWIHVPPYPLLDPPLLGSIIILTFCLILDLC